ncbi:MAG: phytase, partial [Fibrobacterota bacterium]
MKLLLTVLAAALCVSAQVFKISPRVETEPVISRGDAADDMCIWKHPDTPAHSLIIGNNKHETEGGITAYTLAGTAVQRIADAGINNIDIRYGLILAGDTIDLIAGSRRYDSTVALYGIRKNGEIFNVESPTDPVKTLRAYGISLYKSAQDGSLYVFVNDKSGRIEQIRLNIEDSTVTGTSVRMLKVPSQTE